MKNIILFSILLLLFSCGKESIDDFSGTPQFEKSTTEFKDPMRVKTLTIELTKAEEDFQIKILRLSGDEFEKLHQTLTQDELERFAISFLKEESEVLLLENGYDPDFQGNDLKMVHQALKIYGEKINKNQ